MTPVTLPTNKVLSPFNPQNLMIEKMNENSGFESKVPFQEILDKAVNALQDVSDIEYKNNDLVQKYAQGDPRVSVDDVMASTSQLTLAMSLATTVIQTAVTTFNEIKNMPV